MHRNSQHPALHAAMRANDASRSSSSNDDNDNDNNNNNNSILAVWPRMLSVLRTL